MLKPGNLLFVPLVLLLGAPRNVPAAIREAGNGILTIRLSDDPDTIGLFTVGSSTSLAPPDGQNIFFDFKNSKVDTSWVTVRDDSSQTMWVNANPARLPGMASAPGMPGSTYTVQRMNAYPAVIIPVGTVGFIASYTLPGLTVQVEVEVVGSVLADSAVRQTVRVAATDGQPHDVGVRILWDWMVDSVDAAFFRERDPDGAWTRTFTGFAPPYPFARYEVTNSDVTQDFSIYGTIEAPSMATPPTKPDRLLYAGWSNAQNAAWSFSNTGGGVDSAILYYWDPTTIVPGSPAAYTQYVSTRIDALRSPHLVLDYHVSNTGYVCGGDALTYTIGITNDGDATAFDIYITDSMPDALMYLPWSDLFWTTPDGLGLPAITTTAYSSGAAGPWVPGLPMTNTIFGPPPQLLRWGINRLAPGRSAILQFTGNIAPGQTYSVPVKSRASATELYDGRVYGSPEVSSINERVHLFLNALNLAGSSQWLDKDPVRFTIMVQTACQTTVYNLRIFDTVPPGTTLTAPVTLGATITGGTMLLWTIPMLTQGQTAEFSFDTVISCATVFINNTAAVDYDGIKNGAPFPEFRVFSNNAKLDTTCPQLYFRKFASKLHARRGEQITFTLDVLNQYNATLSNIRIWDSLPNGMQYVSGGTYNATDNRVDFAYPDVGPNADVHQDLVVTITSTCYDPDTNLAEMTYTATGSQVPFPPRTAAVHIKLDTPRVVLSPYFSENPVPAYGNATYNIIVGAEPDANDNGWENAVDITFWDTVPANAILLGTTQSPMMTVSVTGVSPQIVTWSVTFLGAGQTTYAAMEVQVTASQYSVCFDKPWGSYTDPAGCVTYSTSNEGGCVNIAQPELALGKRIASEFVPVGGTAEFIFSMTNSGTDSAINLVLTDPITLLPNVAINACSAPPGWTCTLAGTDMVFAGVNLGKGQEATLRFSAIVLSGTLEDCATSASGGNNVGSVSFTNRVNLPMAVSWSNTVCLRSAEAVLNLQKWSNIAKPAVGQRFNYYLSLSNTGGVAAQNITVWDSLPAGVEYIFCQGGSACGHDGGTPGMAMWTVPSIAPGESVQLVLTVSATASPPFACTNYAEADYTNTVPTPRPRAFSNGVCLPITQAYLDVTATMSRPQYAAGEAVTINLSFTNVGDGIHELATADKIAIVDYVDVGSAYRSSTWYVNSDTPGTGLGFYDPSGFIGLGPAPLTATWYGGWASITVVPPIPSCSGQPTSSSHYITVEYENGAVQQPTRTFTFVAFVYSAGLQFTLTPSAWVVSQGGLLTYTMTYANTCSDTLTNLVIWDSVPAGVASTLPLYSFSLGTLAPGASGSRSFTVTVTGLGPWIGPTAAVAAFDNGIGLVQPRLTSAPVTVEVRTPHLTLEKTGPPTGNSANAITFTLTLRNALANSDTAYNVTIVDALPPPLKFVAATTGGVGSVSVSPGGDVVTFSRSRPGVGDVGLAPGETWVVTLDARSPDAQGDYVVTNTAAAGYSTPLGNVGLPTPSGPVTVHLTASLTFKTYPNPFEPGSAVRGTMKFGGLPDGSKVHIYTLAGSTIIDLTSVVQHTIEWDGRNRDGTVVAAGIYLYAVEMPAPRGATTWQRGKFGVIR